MKVGLVVHAARRDSLDAARDGQSILHSLGVDIVLTGLEPDATDLAAPIVDAGAFAQGIDLAISFGGDGTFLRAAHLCRDAGVPVMGVNVGRLGFLAEVERDDLEEALTSMTRDGFTVEERRTLAVTVEDPDGAHIAAGWALNEVSIEKSARQRLLQMEVHVDGRLFSCLPADALIVATATGSTAYALSAGGPIVSPRVDATLVTPVAPHSLFDRTLVAGIDESIRVRVVESQESAVVSCDGRSPVVVPAGGEVVVVGGARPVALARVGAPDFYGLVRRKFNLL